MANPVANLRSPKYERGARPWPLPNTITESICILAGREASAALYIALGKHSAASAAHRATFFEPFTFWDWHGVHPDDTYARERKSQRMWEHQRRFTVDGVHMYGYPTSRERWARFKEDLERCPEKREWVRKLAVAHWMGAGDLLWITENLLQLTALDLGDAPFADSQGNHSWSSLIEPATQKPSGVILELLHRLEWLGLPDFRSPSDHVASLLIRGFLQPCSNLTTLCIRARQSSDDITDPHDLVCKLPSLIATHGRSQLKRLELRLPFFCLDALMAGLIIEESRIRHIGIDLGAWIQLLPKNKRLTNELCEKDVRRVARLAAKKQRFEAYEVAHEERFTSEQKWRLPESEIDHHAPHILGLHSEDAKHVFEHDYYNTDRQSKRPHAPLVAQDRWADGCAFVGHNHPVLQRYVTDMDPNTVPQMLEGIYQAAIKSPEFTLFPLKPELQHNSNKPLHPFTIIHRPISVASSDSKSNFTPGLHQEIYSWLNTTFKWRPIFDWEFYIARSDIAQGPTHKQLWEQYGLDSPDFACNDPHKELAEQLHLMRSVGIPIHIVMGCRHTGTPSLYWGWPYDESVWSKWLTAPFGANIGLFAPLVDTLSIMYDLRDPIRTDAAPEIPSSICPRPVCPWARAKFFCPFKHQWNPTPISPRGQKMANRHTLHPPPVFEPLAPQIDGLPPIGRYDPASREEQSPHVLAAFKREAVGWHRFWFTYAPHFTQLTQLNVRMPATFDTVGSVRLARLLDPAKGWRDIHFATENGEADIGGFVRRTWICPDPKASISDVGESETEREQEQFQKAVKMAAEAAKECEGVELNLLTPDSALESGLRDGYGQRIFRVAKEAWRSRLRDYVIELTDHMTTNSENEPAQLVLQRTRRVLEARALRCSSFQPEDIFTHDPEFRNDIGLVNHPIDYSAAENERRARPAYLESLPDYVSDDSIYASSPSPQTREGFASSAPPAADSAVQDDTAGDAAAKDTAQSSNPSPGLQPTRRSQPLSEDSDTSKHADGGVKSPVDLRGIIDAVQRPSPVTAQLPSLAISQQQGDHDSHILTDLGQVLATLSWADATNTQQPISPQPQVAYNSEVDRLLATLQQNTQHGQIEPVQYEPSRWTGDILSDELENYGEESVGHGLEESHGHLTTPGVAPNVQPSGEVRSAKTETHVHTSSHRIPGLDVVPTAAISTVIHREDTTQTQVIKIGVGEGAPAQPTQQAPTQEARPVKEAVEHKDPLSPTTPSQPQASASKDKTIPEKEPAQLSGPSPKPKTETETKTKMTTSKKSSPPTNPSATKTPKVTKSKKTAEKPAPLQTPDPFTPPAGSKAVETNFPSALPRSVSVAVAKKPPAKRKRKDPVIPDEPVDLSEGRKLRSRTRSRSNTPVYTEESDEDDGGKDVKGGKGGNKGGKKGKGKRATDEEWEEGSVGGDGGRKKK